MAKQSKRPLSSRGVSSIWLSDRVHVARRVLAGLVVLSLGACGFSPIYKFDGTAVPLHISHLSVTGEAIDRAVARNLDRRLERHADADLRAEIKTARRLIEMQKDSDGIARRFEVHYEARVHLALGSDTQESVVQNFRLTQYMTRGDSAADELSQLRRLDDLAARDLTAQILAFIAPYAGAATTP